MASRTDWLDAGLDILTEQGAPALTIERLATRLALTKGSFYHHFKGMSGFKTALLAHFETHRTVRLIEQIEADPTASADEKLQRLVELVLKQELTPRLDVAMRAWAQQDDEVRQLQGRVDQTRVDYLRSLMRGMDRDPGVGHLIYLVLIGASHIIPPLATDELRAMWELTLRTTS